MLICTHGKMVTLLKQVSDIQHVIYIPLLIVNGPRRVASPPSAMWTLLDVLIKWPLSHEIPRTLSRICRSKRGKSPRWKCINLEDPIICLLTVIVYSTPKAMYTMVANDITRWSYTTCISVYMTWLYWTAYCKTVERTWRSPKSILHGKPRLILVRYLYFTFPPTYSYTYIYIYI